MYLKLRQAWMNNYVEKYKSNIKGVGILQIRFEYKELISCINYKQQICEAAFLMNREKLLCHQMDNTEERNI